jgi:hypothetical protein
LFHDLTPRRHSVLIAARRSRHNMPPWREVPSSCDGCAGLAMSRQSFAQGRQIAYAENTRRGNLPQLLAWTSAAIMAQDEEES